MSEQITVCIADNDEDYRRWLERELGSAGDIRIAASVSDGRQALAAVEQHRPQVLLLDPMLPGLDGVGLLRRLRDDSETKCILLSGYFGDGALQSARDAGAYALLPKPVDGASLLEHVHAAGQVHPLCGIYARTALPILEQHLQSGDLRVMALLSELCAIPFETAGRFPDTLFLNINTPQAYNALLEKGGRDD